MKEGKSNGNNWVIVFWWLLITVVSLFVVLEIRESKCQNAEESKQLQLQLNIEDAYDVGCAMALTTIDILSCDEQLESGALTGPEFSVCEDEAYATIYAYLEAQGISKERADEVLDLIFDENGNFLSGR